MPKISILSTLSIGTWPNDHFGTHFNIVCPYDIHLVFLIPNLNIQASREVLYVSIKKGRSIRIYTSLL